MAAPNVGGSVTQVCRKLFNPSSTTPTSNLRGPNFHPFPSTGNKRAKVMPNLDPDDLIDLGDDDTDYMSEGTDNSSSEDLPTSVCAE